MPNGSDIEAAILNRGAFDAVFGGWSSFHDGLLLALRLSAEGPYAPAVEADFELAGGYAEGADGYFRATSLYRVTLRFRQVTDVALDAFTAPNVVGELKLGAAGPSVADGRPVLVAVESIAGCGGDLSLRCAAVEVLAVSGPRPPGA